jgi:glycosyltransferase involved in cell wall biosynthesis
VIPRIAHFVWGFRDDPEPFHFLHYLAVESCRRVVEPEAIYLHHLHPPTGPCWERLAPFVVLVPAEPAAEVLAADYSAGHVPARYRYAHHADVVRLDVLIEHGGLYADLDTVFVRPPRPELWSCPFVIGAEAPVRDEVTGQIRPSLCNAVLMAEPGSTFARAWRAGLGGALNGTWSNHSGFLAEQLSRRLPADVHVEPEETFFAFTADRAGLAALLEEQREVPATASSVHLWAHLWSGRDRRDYSPVHAGWCTPRGLRAASTTLGALAAPYLDRCGPERWTYVSLDEASGYGDAASAVMDALEGAGVDIDWAPLVPGTGWRLGYQPVRPIRDGSIVVAQVVPEYLPLIRSACSSARLIGYTAWETDRIPAHWAPCVEAADLIVVPSRLSAAAFARAGVPVAVVPHVARQDLPRPTARWADLTPDRFVFYTIGDWTERKAIDRCVLAYLRAFRSSDPVTLVIKTSGRDFRQTPPTGRSNVGPGTTARALARLLAGHPDPPHITLVTGRIPATDIAGLHARGDCFVSLCRSEGWGIGACDAATSGNPVVITGYGGHLDFVGESARLVAYELVPVDDPAGWPSYSPDQRWADPDVDHAALLLREVFEHHDAIAAAAREEAPALRARFAPTVVASLLRQAVDSVR